MQNDTAYDDIHHLVEYYIKICRRVAKAEFDKDIPKVEELLKVLFAVEVIAKYENRTGAVIYDLPKKEYVISEERYRLVNKKDKTIIIAP